MRRRTGSHWLTQHVCSSRDTLPLLGKVAPVAADPGVCQIHVSADVALYERHGFEVHGSFKLPGDGPEVFTMWRDAASLR